MSNIQFKDCNFINCNIHAGDNNFSDGLSTEMSNAIGLGGLLLGGVMCCPTLLSTVVPMCVLGAKAFLTGVTVICGVDVLAKTLIKSKECLDYSKLPSPKDTDNCIELEPIRVFDANDSL